MRETLTAKDWLLFDAVEKRISDGLVDFVEKQEVPGEIVIAAAMHAVTRFIVFGFPINSDDKIFEETADHFRSMLREAMDERDGQEELPCE